MTRLFMAAFGGALAVALAAVPASAQPGASDSRSPEAIALQTAVERVCLPVLRGRKITDLVSTAGVRRKDGGWSLEAQGVSDVQIGPPTEVNPHVCSLQLSVAPGDADHLPDFLGRWAQARGLHPVKVGETNRGPFRVRTTWTWEGATPNGALAVVFALESSLDGKPLEGPNAMALVSLTPPATQS